MNNLMTATPVTSRNTSYSNLLASYVKLDFSEDEARAHWHEIEKNKHALEHKIGRSLSIETAITDYFTNIHQLLESPILIETHIFQQTQQLAMIDSLTGVFNRRYMDLILKRELNRSERNGKDFSICLLDIDNFKMVNDTRGHQFGDEVLKTLSRLLGDSVREEDVVCRYGGEEFILILPETNEEGAFHLVERIRTDMKDHTFFKEHQITFSAGTATYPVCARTIETLIHAADTALYQAKHDGKDRVISSRAERRQYSRHPHGWIIKIFTESGTVELTDAISNDMSLGGIQFETHSKLLTNSTITFQFTHPGSPDYEIAAEGRIVWTKKKGKLNSYGANFMTNPVSIDSRKLPQEESVSNAV